MVPHESSALEVDALERIEVRRVKFENLGHVKDRLLSPAKKNGSFEFRHPSPRSFRIENCQMSTTGIPTIDPKVHGPEVDKL